jgi:hypothetical protein
LFAFALLLAFQIVSVGFTSRSHQQQRWQTTACMMSVWLCASCGCSTSPPTSNTWQQQQQQQQQQDSLVLCATCSERPINCPQFTAAAAAAGHNHVKSTHNACTT